MFCQNTQGNKGGVAQFFFIGCVQDKDFAYQYKFCNTKVKKKCHKCVKINFLCDFLGYWGFFFRFVAFNVITGGN